jgi:hypothetical protein
MRHAPGLHPCNRWTAVLGMLVLAVAMVLLGSIALAFYTQLESDRWLRLGATDFFAAMGLSALLVTAQLAGTLWLSISPSQHLSPRLRWMLAALIPVDILAMGFGCGGCNLLCLGLLAAAWMMAGLVVLEVRGGAPLLLSLSLLYAIPHCICANVINRWWIEQIGASPNCYTFSLVGIGFAVLRLRGVWSRLVLVLAAAPGGAAVAIGIGHHVFGYPWSRHEGPQNDNFMLAGVRALRLEHPSVLPDVDRAVSLHAGCDMTLEPRYRVLRQISRRPDVRH